MQFIIVTDSCSDMPADLLREWGVACADMHFRFEGEDGEYTSRSMPADRFYRKMREGAVTRTSAVNSEDFAAVFEPAVSEGKDVLYIGFSAGLSTTFNCARIAAEEVMARNPGSRVLLVDTMTGSAGEGLILELVVDLCRQGANIDEAYAYAKELAHRVHSWFTVDDLVYLKRGGRIGAAAAFAAGTLNIKPLIGTDGEGHLASAGKAIGRKAALKLLASKYISLAATPERGKYFIAHSDCLEDAMQLEEMIFTKTGNHACRVESIGAIMGSHCGPGTLALFYVGK